MWRKLKSFLLISLLMASGYSAYSADPPPQLYDEGVKAGVIFNWDCRGAGINCTKSGNTGTFRIGDSSGRLSTVATAYPGYNIDITSGATTKWIDMDLSGVSEMYDGQIFGIAGRFFRSGSSNIYGEEDLGVFIGLDGSTNEATIAGNIITSNYTGCERLTTNGSGALSCDTAITLSDLSDVNTGTATSGNLLIADGTDWESVAMSGDITITSTGITTVQLNSVALTTDTTGNYIDSISAGVGISIPGVAGEGSTPVVSLEETASLSGNHTLNANQEKFGLSGIIFEGATSNTIEGYLVFPDPSGADISITLFNATDTVVGKATTDTLTNKTFNTAGTGNVLQINSNTVNAVTGTGSTVVLSAGPTLTGTTTVGDINTGNGAVELAAGTYTPTLTNVTNISASTAYQAQYLRVGATVTVSGKVDIDTTAPGAAELGVSLPITSNFGAEEDCAGILNEVTASPDPGYIKADTTNDRASFNQQNVDTTNHAHYFTFTYQII